MLYISRLLFANRCLAVDRLGQLVACSFHSNRRMCCGLHIGLLWPAVQLLCWYFNRLKNIEEQIKQVKDRVRVSKLYNRSYMHILLELIDLCSRSGIQLPKTSRNSLRNRSIPSGFLEYYTYLKVFQFS